MKKKINPIAQAIMESNEVENMADVQSLMKNLYKDMISILLESEMNETLGYSKHERSSNANSRNGYNHKTVKTSLGEVDLDIPRDRKGEFEPVAVPKHSRDISDLEDKIISMYSRGMSTSDINEHIEEIYGISFSPSQISRITDNVLEELDTWKKRPLKSCYPFVFLDAMYFNVKSNGKIVKKAAQVVIGIDLEGKKDILNISIAEGETSKSWLKILDDLRIRGVEKILIISVDGHKSFGSAIEAIYPETKIQRCIVHQIRNTLKFLNYKEKKVFSKELKEVYTAKDIQDNIGKGMKNVYKYMINDCKESIKEVFQAISRAESGICIHCTAGKDRTGIVMALIGLLINETKENITRDYLASEIDTRQEYIEEVFERVEEEGGIEEYLLNCGIEKNTLNLVREKLGA